LFFLNKLAIFHVWGFPALHLIASCHPRPTAGKVARLPLLGIAPIVIYISIHVQVATFHKKML
jgi:hypothetical protein